MSTEYNTGNLYWIRLKSLEGDLYNYWDLKSNYINIFNIY